MKHNYNNKGKQEGEPPHIALLLIENISLIGLQIRMMARGFQHINQNNLRA